MNQPAPTTASTSMARSQQPAVQVPLTPLERDLAALLADMLVADVEAERAARLEREGEPTVDHARR
jgi:hypothetical protein